MGVERRSRADVRLAITIRIGGVGSVFRKPKWNCPATVDIAIKCEIAECAVHCEVGESWHHSMCLSWKVQLMFGK